MCRIDIERVRLGTSIIPTKQTLTPLKRHSRGSWFLKGPIPGDWLSQAAALPGKSLHVGLALWYLVGLNKQRGVTLTRAVLAKFAVMPDAGRRGLQQLEDAGLVVVQRHSGRCPRVTLLAIENTTIHNN